MPISLAAVTELASGTWVNDPFTAVVEKIERKTTGPKSKRPNSPFWVVKLCDTTGSATADCPVFTAPHFSEGDQIEVSGQGIKFKHDNYGNHITWGDKASVIVLGQSAHREEQVQRKAASQPSVSGEVFPVPGPTVGMAINNALTVLTDGLDYSDKIAALNSPSFSQSVYEVASDVIRIARLLEAGKLAPSVKQRAGGATAPHGAPAESSAKPTSATSSASPRRGQPVSEDQAANIDPNAPDDPPF